jgi:hypothetical protein
MILFDSTFVLNLELVIDSVGLSLNSILGSFIDLLFRFYTPLKSNLFSIAIIWLGLLLLTVMKVETEVS